MTPEEIKIDLWKTAVNTQQHFNTLQLQLRNYTLTLYLAILTAAGYGIKENIRITVLSHTFSIAILACIAGIFVVFAFYYTDWGYFQLLKGAVGHGIAIEQDLARNHAQPLAGLAQAIGNYSHSKRFLGVFPRGASARFHSFYALLFLGLLAISLFGQFAVGHQASKAEQTPAPSAATNSVIRTQ